MKNGISKRDDIIEDCSIHRSRPAFVRLGVAAGSPPLVFGDGKQMMDFVKVENVARAKILTAESPVTAAVFVASGVKTSLNELLDVLLKVMDSSLLPEHREECKVNPVPRRFADTRRAEQ